MMNNHGQGLTNECRPLSAVASRDGRKLALGIIHAQQNLIHSGSIAQMEVVADNEGYHANETITEDMPYGPRTRIAEPNAQYEPVWIGKPQKVQ